MKKGFTLVELSIVLVILGLLVGGVLAGQNLIRAAELRSVVTDFTNYQTAILAFREKYFQYPGDMDNATAFWGSAGGSGNIGDGCESATPTGTTTCNGDGNGMVAQTSSAAVENHEKFQAWRHLANAGLVEGSFSGMPGPNATLRQAIIGENVPASRVSGAGFTLTTLTTAASIHTSNTSWFPGGYGVTLMFGSQNTTTETFNIILVPEEAWGIDKKIDDGRPGLGRLVAREATANCHTNSDPDLSEYALDFTEIACSLTMKNM